MGTLPPAFVVWLRVDHAWVLFPTGVLSISKIGSIMVYSVCLFCFDRLSNMWYCVEHQSHRRERKVCVHICMSCIYIYKVQTSDRVQFGKSCMIHWSTIELMKRRIAAPMHEWRAFPGWFAAPIQGSEADFQSCAWGEVICERSTWIFLPYRSIWRYVCTIFVFICRMANLIPKNYYVERCDEYKSWLQWLMDALRVQSLCMS